MENKKERKKNKKKARFRGDTPETGQDKSMRGWEYPPHYF